jgi:hypothetical protein
MMAAAAAPATGVVDDFASGGYATAGNQAGGMETFGFNPQHQTSPDFLEGTVNVDTFSNMPASAPAPMTGPETFGDWNQGVAQGYNFAGPQMTAPGQSTSSFSSDYGTYATPQASQYGAMSELGLTGHQFAQGNPIGYAGPYDITTSQNVEDQLTGGGVAAVDSFTNMPGALSASQPGMIAAGTTSPEQAAIEADIAAGSPYGEMDEGTLDPNAGGVSAPAAYQDQIQRIPGDTTVTQAVKGTPEYHAIQKEQIDKSIMTVSEGLMAKAKADPNGIAIEGTNITNQRMANAFNSLDQYSKAYSASQGTSFIGGLIAGAMPFGAAVKGINGWLQSKGMYNKQTGQDLLTIMQSALDTGDLNQIVRDLGGGGPSTEDVEGPAEIRSFIQQYPWAAELDPKYIKYLIDNPAELQDLLGQGPGGGDQQV